MIFREAIIADIPQIQFVRNAVKENILSNPALVTDDDCKQYLKEKGKGWVCEADNQIVGFSIISLEDKNIWALFVHPEFEGKGIGRTLCNVMLNWYFNQTQETVWPSTHARHKSRKALSQSRMGRGRYIW